MCDLFSDVLHSPWLILGASMTVLVSAPTPTDNYRSQIPFGNVVNTFVIPPVAEVAILATLSFVPCMRTGVTPGRRTSIVEHTP